MANPLRLKVLSLLAKIEALYAQDAAPTGALNAILLVGNPTLTPMEMTTVERETLRPYFGNYESLPGSLYGKLDFEVEAAGSGVAGEAPAWGPLARMCSYAETLLAAAITGTAQAGGSTSSIKLAAAASAVDGFYNGLPISITAGTGVDNTLGLIISYNGTTKIAEVSAKTWVAPDATSQYSIGAAVTYKRITDAPESGTLMMNIDGVLHKFLGVRGNMTSSFAANGRPTFKFAMMGLYVPVIDATKPTVKFDKWQRPLLANFANTPLFDVHGYKAAGLESFDYDTGNTVEHRTLINLAETMELTDSKPSAKFNIQATKMSEKDWFAAVKDVSLGRFALLHGLTSGNRLGITMPSMQIAKPTYGESQKLLMMSADLMPQPVYGNDEVVITAF